VEFAGQKREGVCDSENQIGLSSVASMAEDAGANLAQPTQSAS